jgi:hypothetical protein
MLTGITITYDEDISCCTDFISAIKKKTSVLMGHSISVGNCSVFMK